jgi:hypothetical protein
MTRPEYFMLAVDNCLGHGQNGLPEENYRGHVISSTEISPRKVDAIPFTKDPLCQCWTQSTHLACV